MVCDGGAVVCDGGSVAVVCDRGSVAVVCDGGSVAVVCDGGGQVPTDKVETSSMATTSTHWVSGDMSCVPWSKLSISG